MKEITLEQQETALYTLRSFLSVPLNDGTEILDRFASLPSAICQVGNHKMERYVYVPGSRKDRVVLIAHVDTVWDKHYPNEAMGSPAIYLEDRVYTDSAHGGIGADDRAGCALLWLLKDSGHSLLLLDGEEKGHYGAKFLARENKKLLRELNRHRYMLALDYPGKDICHYHNIYNTKAFQAYIEHTYQCKPNTEKKGSDLPHLTRSTCGANLAIGYYREHSPGEILSLRQWMCLYEKLSHALELPQKNYRARWIPRFRDRLINEMKSLWGTLRRFKK